MALLIHSKRFLSISHTQGVRSDTEMGRRWLIQGLKAAQGKL